MKFRAAPPAPHHNVRQEKIGFLDRLLIKPQRERSEFNRRMFDEDFARIFTYYNRRSDKFFDIDTNNQELSDRLLGNVRTRNGPHPIDKTIYELIAEIAQSLMWFGVSYYFLHDDADTNKTYITSFPAGRVFSCLGRHFQYLPKRIETYWDKENKELPREIRLLNKKKLLRFRLPKSIKRNLRSQNKVLAALDRNQGASTKFFPQATHENPNPPVYFDFRIWREIEDKALYRATQETGWNGRKCDSTRRSDFFDCFRRLRFRRNQLILRDALLKQLSDELTRVGRYYERGFRVKISPTDALPSVEELDELKAKLSREEVGFSEVIDFCFKR